MSIKVVQAESAVALEALLVVLKKDGWYPISHHVAFVPMGADMPEPATPPPGPRRAGRPPQSHHTSSALPAAVWSALLILP